MIYSIGHSAQPIEVFVGHLKQFDITVLIDVRSIPYSKRHPQFNREALSASLSNQGIEYVFAGDALGGKPKDPTVYRKGRVAYSLLRQRPYFQEGLQQLIAMDAPTKHIAIMCAEKDPLRCHRFHLVSEALWDRGIEVLHLYPVEVPKRRLIPIEHGRLKQWHSSVKRKLL